jgi:predicted nucleic acid-binding protein
MASLTELVSDLYVWGFDRGAAEIAGEILNQQKSLNRPINPTEAQIAAVARQRQAVLLSGSEHFSDVRDIEHQNWIV